jgi:hypothetical protein
VLGKFWEGVGGKLAERWAAMAGPALVFWVGALLAWAHHAGGLYELSKVTSWLNRQDTVNQLAVLVTAMLAVLASSVIIDRLTFPALRLLEGYWPGWLAPLRRGRIARVQARAATEDSDWQRLAADVLARPESASAGQLAEFARLDQRRRRRPSNPSRYLPTRIGNILRAAETQPSDKYGLDAVVIWPRLWLLLPDTSRQELQAARASLDGAVAAVLWGLLFCAFAVWTPLVIPIGLAVAVAAVWFWVPARAETFGDLLEAAYDLHRTALYQQLRWPLPTNPKEEPRHGEQLTVYLSRGSNDPDPTFTPPR